MAVADLPPNVDRDDLVSVVARLTADNDDNDRAGDLLDVVTDVKLDVL